MRKGFDVSSVSSEGLAKGFVDMSMPGESAKGISSAVEDAETAAAAAAAAAGRALLALLSDSGTDCLSSEALEAPYRGCLPVNSPLRGPCC